MSSNAIEQLRDDSKYYGDYGKQWLSNSDIGVLLSNPRMFRQQREPDKALLQGGYLHQLMLEPDKDPPVVSSASSRNTKAYKEIGEFVMLESEKLEVESWQKALNANLRVYDLLYEQCHTYETPGVSEIFGYPFKGKADAISDTHVIDLKTTRDLARFKSSAYRYGYNSQAYIYEQIFGLPVKFVVIDKATLQIGIFECSAEFMQSGHHRVLEGLEVYKKFFEQNESIDNHVLEDTL